MPIYEFRCQDCGKQISVLMRINDQPENFHCPSCNNTNLKKLLSRFASPKSEDARMESLADPSKWRGLDENDPKSMIDLMKKMGKEMGEEAGEEFDQMIEEAEEEAYKGNSSKGTDDNLYTPGELSG